MRDHFHHLDRILPRSCILDEKYPVFEINNNDVETVVNHTDVKLSLNNLFHFNSTTDSDVYVSCKTCCDRCSKKCLNQSCGGMFINEKIPSGWNSTSDQEQSFPVAISQALNIPCFELEGCPSHQTGNDTLSIISRISCSQPNESLVEIIDCSVSKWTPWSNCSRLTEADYCAQNRFRTYTVSPPSPHCANFLLHEVRACLNESEIPKTCEVEDPGGLFQKCETDFKKQLIQFCQGTCGNGQLIEIPKYKDLRCFAIPKFRALKSELCSNPCKNDCVFVSNQLLQSVVISPLKFHNQSCGHSKMIIHLINVTNYALEGNDMVSNECPTNQPYIVPMIFEETECMLEQLATSTLIPCPNPTWSTWSTCSSTCNVGMRIRKREVIYKGNCSSLEQQEPCMNNVCSEFIKENYCLDMCFLRMDADSYISDKIRIAGNESCTYRSQDDVDCPPVSIKIGLSLNESGVANLCKQQFNLQLANFCGSTCRNQRSMIQVMEYVNTSFSCYSFPALRILKTEMCPEPCASDCLFRVQILDFMISSKLMFKNRSCGQSKRLLQYTRILNYSVEGDDLVSDKCPTNEDYLVTKYLHQSECQPPSNRLRKRQALVCGQSLWTSWSTCSVACNVGTRARSRQISYSGSCESVVDQEPCMRSVCPVYISNNYCVYLPYEQADGNEIVSSRIKISGNDNCTDHGTDAGFSTSRVSIQPTSTTTKIPGPFPTPNDATVMVSRQFNGRRSTEPQVVEEHEEQHNEREEFVLGEINVDPEPVIQPKVEEFEMPSESLRTPSVPELKSEVKQKEPKSLEKVKSAPILSDPFKTESATTISAPLTSTGSTTDIGARVFAQMLIGQPVKLADTKVREVEMQQATGSTTELKLNDLVSHSQLTTETNSSTMQSTDTPNQSTTTLTVNNRGQLQKITELKKFDT